MSGFPLKVNVMKLRTALVLATLLACVTTGSPSLAATGTVRIIFGSTGIIVGTGGGKGTLTFQGREYLFAVSGVSLGATLSQSAGVLEGRVQGLNAPGDLGGSYVAVGAGAALVGGGGAARLRNANGVTLVVRGVRLGAGISVNLARVTITMM
jgi:hypothetical protein